MNSKNYKRENQVVRKQSLLKDDQLNANLTETELKKALNEAMQNTDLPVMSQVSRILLQYQRTFH